jgi:hypothetical protein
VIEARIQAYQPHDCVLEVGLGIDQSLRHYRC